jgi:hypothetical protein
MTLHEGGGIYFSPMARTGERHHPQRESGIFRNWAKAPEGSVSLATTSIMINQWTIPDDADLNLAGRAREMMDSGRYAVWYFFLL